MNFDLERMKVALEVFRKTLLEGATEIMKDKNLFSGNVKEVSGCKESS